MANRVRVLIVDDSVLARHRLQKIIDQTPGFQVVGAASNGQECLDLLATTRPDVISLDMWMPGMDGLTILRRIMQERPTPVVMVSALTEAGARVTLDALALGAVDYLTKPAAVPSKPGDAFGRELLHKLAIAAQVPASHLGSQPSPPGVCHTPLRTTHHSPLTTHHSAGRALVVIGSSTGGPQALDCLFSGLPANIAAAILIVQHMPALFTQSLAAHLARRSGLDVREVQEGDQVVDGLARVAQGGSHMTLGADQHLHVDQTAPIHNVRPAIDRTLMSVAACWNGRCLAVILTGMGTDGTDGARAVRAKGADILAQDESTSIVYGMPRSVVEAGLASAVLPIDDMAGAIERWARAETPARVGAV